jgi:hypothetical protein
MNGVTTDEIMESDLAVLVRCGILPERIADLFWGWGVRRIGDFIAARDVFPRLPHLQSEVAQRELKEAADTVERAMELLRLGRRASAS